MDQIDSMAHPLVGNAAGKFLVQTKLEIGAWIERPIEFGEQPFAPIGVLFANLLDLGPTPPAGTVVIPDRFRFGYVTQRSTRDAFFRDHLIRLAAMLRAHLHDPSARSHGVARTDR